MASVNYTIKGKNDNSAVKQALSGFKNLEKSVKRINNVISGFAGLKVFQAIKAVSTETNNIFRNQNAAVVKFNTAVSKTNLNLSRLQAIQGKLSKNNFFDGDTLNNAMQLGVQMGLTENQIEKVMTAATDMAASGIMPLDNAVKALSVSYSGNVGQLKKIAPELDNLTRNQLKNGEAVDILMKKYAGFGDAVSNTFSGRNTQWQNSIDDLKASIGSIPASLEFITQGKLLEPLNKITEWITQNRDYILNFFINLPAIAAVAFKKIQEGFKKVFSAEGLKSIVKAISDSIYNVSSTTLNIVAELIKGIIKMIKEFCDNLETGDIGKLLLNAWYAICNQLNEMFFKVFDVAIELIEGRGIKSAMAVAAGTKTGKIAGALHYDYDKVDTTKAVTAVSKVAQDMIKTVEGFGASLLEDQKKVVVDFLDNFEGLGEDALKEIKDILGKDLPDDLKAALEGVVYNGSGTGGTGTGTGGSGTDKKTQDSILGHLGQIGTYIKAGQENGLTGVLIQLVGDILAGMTATSELINNVLNVVTFALQSVIEPLVNLIEPVIAPLMSIIKSIGSIIGAFIPILQPILDFIGSQIMSIAKMIFWFRTFFVSLFDTIRYGFTEVENWIIKLYNKINGWGKDIDYRQQAKSWDEIAEEWKSLVNGSKLEEAFRASLGSTGSAASGASAGKAASYTAARDVNVYFSFNNSYVNGDAEAIAVALHKEMRSAERKGLI